MKGRREEWMQWPSGHISSVEHSRGFLMQICAVCYQSSLLLGGVKVEAVLWDFVGT